VWKYQITQFAVALLQLRSEKTILLRIERFTIKHAFFYVLFVREFYDRIYKHDIFFKQTRSSFRNGVIFNQIVFCWNVFFIL